MNVAVGPEFETFADRHRAIWGGGDDSGVHNQTVFVRFPGETAVKFHARSLLEVLTLEGVALLPVR